MNTLYNRFTLDYSRQKSKDIWLPFQAMITAGQRSGQKHLASLPGPSRSTTRMKRIGSSSWSSCMSMHGERGKKSKTMTPWGPLGTSWNFVKGKWSNREVFLFHSWLKISDLNLKGCLQRRDTEVQDSVPLSCLLYRQVLQPNVARQQDWKKEVSRLLVSSFLHESLIFRSVNLRFSETLRGFTGHTLDPEMSRSRPLTGTSNDMNESCES